VFKYDEFIEKLINIYNNCQNKLKNENINENNDKIMVKGNKKSKEEKQEIFEKRKIEKQNILLNKYNDEKYKMKRANELAENRQNMYTHEE
jgi:predicted phosphodiesterase